MIFYFSGTGNSRYVAKSIANLTDDSLFFIPDLGPCDLKEEDAENATSIGIVCPVYSWGIPPIVVEFIRNWPTVFSEHIYADRMPVWLVLTCGDETGMAPEMFKAVLAEKALALSACWSVVMPNNYVLLPGFNVDPKKVEEEKIENAPERIRHIAEKIVSGCWEEDFVRGPHPKMKTRMIYPLFKKWGISRKKWKWTPECVRCGKCAEACPVGNIRMKGEHPSWNDNCTSCLACYHVCPTHSVAYGGATAHKGQYRCTLAPLKKHN